MENEKKYYLMKIGNYSNVFILISNVIDHVLTFLKEGKINEINFIKEI